jgi:hypothetical protein
VAARVANRRPSKITISKATVDAYYIAEAVRLVRSVEGVTGVESHIVPIGFQPIELFGD